MSDVRLSDRDLAERTGLGVGEIHRYAELGLLLPAGDGTFASSDIRLVGLLRAFEAGGISLDAVGKAIADGQTSMAFIEPIFSQRSPARTDRTLGQHAADLGVDPELLATFFETSGFPRPAVDQPIREDDAEALPLMVAVLALSPDPGPVLRAARVYADHVRQIAEAEPQFFHSIIEEPMLRSGMSEQEMRRLTAEMSTRTAEIAEGLMLWTYRRHQEHYVIDHLLEHLEDTLERAGLEGRRHSDPPAMCFLDLEGYTRLTEEEGDEAAAEIASRLADLVSGTARRHGGRAVKWLGDGVMFHFPEVAKGLAAALLLVEQVPEAGLPRAHVGIAAGPVVVRDGDYFGRTVNTAARVASRAAGGEVLVTEQVRAAGGEVADFEEVGPVPLDGLPAPIALYRASPRRS